MFYKEIGTLNLIAGFGLKVRLASLLKLKTNLTHCSKYDVNFSAAQHMHAQSPTCMFVNCEIGL